MAENINVVASPEVATNDNLERRLIFLAGGITGCGDWQTSIINLIDVKVNGSGKDICLLNPRRKEFDVNKPLMTKDQIDWEYKYLRLAKEIVFWFPQETLCPITLFELGAALERSQKLYIGCNQDYKRRSDVEYQTYLKRPKLQIVYSIKDLADQVLA